jgi:uncharacterized membrane protein
LKAKGRISSGGAFIQSKEKHLKQGEKFQILKMLLEIIFLYTFGYWQKNLKRFSQKICKKTSKWWKCGPKC